MNKKVIVNEHTQLPDSMKQEELDEMIAALQKMVDEGTLEENSREVTYEELEAVGINLDSFFEENQKH